MIMIHFMNQLINRNKAHKPTHILVIWINVCYCYSNYLIYYSYDNMI